MFATPAFLSLRRGKATVTAWPWRILTIPFSLSQRNHVSDLLFYPLFKQTGGISFSTRNKVKKCDDDYDRSVGLFLYCNLYIMVIHLFERRSQGKCRGKAVPVQAMKASGSIVYLQSFISWATEICCQFHAPVALPLERSPPSTPMSYMAGLDS